MLKKSSVLCALLAAASSLPLFADEYGFHFMPLSAQKPADVIINCDPISGNCSASSAFDWVSGGYELFHFGLDAETPSPSPACYVGSSTFAEVINCLTSTVATDPSISHLWSVSKGAGWNGTSNQNADLLLTVSDAQGSLYLDSGSTPGSGCAPNDPNPTCGYGGTTYNGTFTVTAVPEPGSVGLTLIMLGLLGLTRKRIVPASR